MFQNNKDAKILDQEFDYIFKEVKNYSNKINAKLYFVYLPAHYPALRNWHRKKIRIYLLSKNLKTY